MFLEKGKHGGDYTYFCFTNPYFYISQVENGLYDLCHEIILPGQKVKLYFDIDYDTKNKKDPGENKKVIIILKQIILLISRIIAYAKIFKND